MAVLTVKHSVRGSYVKPLHRHRAKIGHNKVLHGVVFVIAMATFSLNAANAYGQDMRRAEYRAVAGMDQFDDVLQVAVAFRMRPPRRLRMNRLELAVGAISTPRENHAMLSFGPVWQLPSGGRRWFVDLGISPTVLSGATFNGRDIGGAFHFTSSIAAGLHLGARRSVVLALRLQHTSNGGIDRPNPGMDMIGLNVSVDLGSG